MGKKYGFACFLLNIWISNLKNKLKCKWNLAEYLKECKKEKREGFSRSNCLFAIWEKIGFWVHRNDFIGKL